jgi:hypothetical protein
MSTVLPVVEETWHLNEVIASMDYAELAQFYTDLMTNHAEVALMLKRINEVKKAVEQDIVPDKLDADDMVNVTIADSEGNKKRWQTSGQLQCGVLAADREALYKWLEEHGNESLITDTVNSSTLKAFVKKLIKEGKEVPDMVNIHPYQQASLVKVP